MNASGIMLAVGTCDERTLIEKDPLAIMKRVAGKSEGFTPREKRRSELAPLTKQSTTE